MSDTTHQIADYLGLDEADLDPTPGEVAERRRLIDESDQFFASGGKVLSVRMTGQDNARLQQAAGVAGAESVSALVRGLIAGVCARAEDAAPAGAQTPA
jgi:hypothetical protein